MLAQSYNTKVAKKEFDKTFYFLFLVCTIVSNARLSIYSLATFIYMT